ncbi:MAG: tetratricopeptide repeat protein, partial [Limnobacter sp.]|nr:tetratricopeptide repeat protein [Limnobacter sp.]
MKSNAVRFILIGCLFGLTSISSPSYALFDDEEARKAILSVRKQMEQMEQRLSRLETSAQGQLSVLDTLSEKDREIARLRGELEVTNNAIRKLQEDYKQLYALIDERLGKLEPKQYDLGGQSVSVDQQQATAYDAALEHFKAGNFKQAEAGFAYFLKEYPKSSLEPQVRYFLGSCQYANGDYKSALVTQRDLANDFPDHARAPDALLSMASSQIELKSIPRAK